MSKAESLADRQEIRELIENWALWRDAGNWDGLMSLWHPRGQMVATWSEAAAQDFVARSRAAWDGGMQVVHSLGGACIDVRGPRAIAETRMEITQRAIVHDIQVDVQCKGLFWDALIKEEGGWLLVLRRPIYEMDRLTPVDPAQVIALDPDLLSKFPDGYRHLAYLQTLTGLNVNPHLPEGRGPEVAALRERGRQWLDGCSMGVLLSSQNNVSLAV